MVFINMRFEGRGLLPDTVMWFPEKEFPFFRLTEATFQCHGLRPKAKQLLLLILVVKKMMRYGRWMNKN